MFPRRTEKEKETRECKRCHVIYSGDAIDKHFTLVNGKYYRGVCDSCRYDHDTLQKFLRNKKAGKYPEYKAQNYHLLSCDRCPCMENCNKRVKVGLWVQCEVPNENDFRWAITMVDSQTRTELLKPRFGHMNPNYSRGATTTRRIRDRLKRMREK